MTLRVFFNLNDFGILWFSLLSLLWCWMDTSLKVWAKLNDTPLWTLQYLIYHLFLCCALHLYLACGFLTVNTRINSPGWILAVWYYTGVIQDWWRRDESSCLDFKSSSPTPELLCLYTKKKSALLSFNKFLPDNFISNSLLPLCNKQWHPDKPLLSDPQHLPPVTSSTLPCVPSAALQSSLVLERNK